MSLTGTVKRLAIATGTYRPMRWLARRVHPRQLGELRADIELYRSLLRPGSLCFDVGANIGEKSESLLAVGSRVVAFEPNPQVLPELRARCGSNANWTLVAAALGSGAAISPLYARAGHANSGLFQGGEVVATYDVPVVTLDAAIRRFGAPAFCKIDVEGWELEVLKGLSEPIPLMSFEFSLSERGVEKTRACLERLAAFGPCRANLTPAETPRFHIPEWMPLAKLLEWFPGDLKRSLPGDPYGDIYVQREAV